MFSLGTVALAMFVVITPAIAANTHDGKVVSITGNKLVMKNTDGKEHSHTLTADAKVTCDGTVCKCKTSRPARRSV